MAINAGLREATDKKEMTLMADSEFSGAGSVDARLTETTGEGENPTLPPPEALGGPVTIPIGAPQRFCLNCHSPVAGEAAFCQACGAAVPGSSGASSPVTAHPSSGAASSPISMIRPASSSVSTSVGSATRASVRTPVAKKSVTGGEVVGLIADLIGGTWNLLVSAAVIIVVVVGGIAFIKSHFGSSLNEHSTCQQFEQADASAQDKVLQDMITAHGGHDSVTTARFSVNLYCSIYGGGAHIDGVYGSGYVSAGADRVSRGAAPALVYVVYASQART